MQEALRRRQGALGAGNAAIPQGTVAGQADIVQKIASNEMAKKVAAQKHGGDMALNDRRLALGQGQLGLKKQELAFQQKVRNQELANARATLDANRDQSRTLSALGGVGLAVDAVGAWNTHKTTQRIKDAFKTMMETAKQTGDANLAAQIQLAEWFANNTGSAPVIGPVLGFRP